MPSIVEINQNAIGNAWVKYLKRHTKIQHFGNIRLNGKVAKYPYANFQIIGMPSNSVDLENNEDTVDLTVQTDILESDTGKSTTSQVTGILLSGDRANAQFFANLGFHRMGTSQFIQEGTGIHRITSRFIFRNFTGEFLTSLDKIE